MLEWLEIIGLVLIASTKFLFAPAAIYGLDFSFVQAVAICLTGGAIGILVFFILGNAIRKWWDNRFSSGKRKKVFSRRSRWLSKVRSTYGIYGLAFITPCIISIPIGCFLTARYYGSDRRALPLLFMALVFWAFVLCGITYTVGPIFG